MKDSKRRQLIAKRKPTAILPGRVLAFLFIWALAASWTPVGRSRFPRRTSVEKYHDHAVVSGQILIRFRDPERWRNLKDQETKITAIANEAVPFEAIGTSDVLLVQCPDKESIPSLIERFKHD